MEILSTEQRDFYSENGYLVLDSHLQQLVIKQAHGDNVRKDTDCFAGLLAGSER